MGGGGGGGVFTVLLYAAKKNAQSNLPDEGHFKSDPSRNNLSTPSESGGISFEGHGFLRESAAGRRAALLLTKEVVPVGHVISFCVWERERGIRVVFRRLLRYACRLSHLLELRVTSSNPWDLAEKAKHTRD